MIKHEVDVLEKKLIAEVAKGIFKDIEKAGYATTPDTVFGRIKKKWLKPLT